MSTTHFTLIDAIYHSRMTLLDLLEARGYDVERYRNFTPDEAALAVPHYNGLSFKLTKTELDGIVTTCDVQYTALTRQNLDKFFLPVNYPDETAPNTEVIVMMQTPLADAHHVCSLKQYIKFKKDSTERRNLRVSFFYINSIVVNPLKHVLVPKHVIVPKEEHKALMDSLYVVSKTKFPEIKYHIDPITRCIGAVPGDIIKITRPSGSAGETVVYRVCVA
jgi:DNA-directed RNA polymerase subunit H (RpoH/RPB5)